MGYTKSIALKSRKRPGLDRRKYVYAAVRGRCFADQHRRRNEDFISRLRDERDRQPRAPRRARRLETGAPPHRSEEHTSELQSLMRISYAVFCLTKKKNKNKTNTTLKPSKQ